MTLNTTMHRNTAMHQWHWHTWNGLPYLTCSLLQSWRHGFFTRQFYPQSPADLSAILHPEAEVFRVKQVHGNTVLRTSEVRSAECGVRSAELKNPEPRTMNSELRTVNPELRTPHSEPRTFKDEYPAADGLVTDAENQAVWACSADCTPVLIADERSGRVAAVHSGWRGTAQTIVLEAVWRLVEQGSQLTDLRVALGPAIAGEVYQVGKDVAAETGATLVSTPSESSDAAVDDVLAALAALPDSPIFPDSDPERVRLDVRRVIALQLEQLGLLPEQVAIAPHCTYQQPEWFFSYRRDRQKLIQWSGIVSK